MMVKRNEEFLVRVNKVKNFEFCFWTCKEWSDFFGGHLKLHTFANTLSLILAFFVWREWAQNTPRLCLNVNGLLEEVVDTCFVKQNCLKDCFNFFQFSLDFVQQFFSKNWTNIKTLICSKVSSHLGSSETSSSETVFRRFASPSSVINEIACAKSARCCCSSNSLYRSKFNAE